jgi:hypothetical protein
MFSCSEGVTNSDQASNSDASNINVSSNVSDSDSSEEWEYISDEIPDKDETTDEGLQINGAYVFQSWKALLNRFPKYNDNVPDLTPIARAINTKSGKYCYCHQFIDGVSQFSVYTKHINIKLFLLNTEEQKSFPSYYGIVRSYDRMQLHYDDINNIARNIVDDEEQYTQDVRQNTVFKYTKEGIDIFISTDDGKTNDYKIGFRIKDFVFSVSGKALLLNDNFNLPTKNDLDQHSISDNGERLLLELADRTHENSELVRILKECVAEAE